ncbi:MAG: PKD domain-containing protein [Candidatus Kuenenia sp.]|nr:PKD domain-containing protein [Candidatus Kuenenia sp.]
MIRKGLFIIMVCCLFNQKLLAETTVVRLSAGKPVLLALKERIDAAEKQEGDLIKLMVIRPVKVDGMIVINKGADAFGRIAEIKKGKSWGRKGEFTIRVDAVTAVDDTEVPLNATQTKEGKSHVGGATALAATTGILLCPLIAPTGFLIKGEAGELPVGCEIKAYVDDDVDVKVDPSAQTEDVNLPPLADAGDNQAVKAGNLVKLDGSRSTDLDGDQISYMWAFESMPADSRVRLSDSETATPSFVPDTIGTYIIKMTVSDGKDESSSTCTIEAGMPDNGIGG